MASNGTQFWDDSIGLQMEPEFSADEKQLRELFITQYLKDYNAYHAALRTGFMGAFALEWAKRMMQESYTQRRIAERQREDHEKAQGKNYDHIQIVANLRQIAYNELTPAAARVAALNKLAALTGLDKQEESASGPAGGVIEVPTIARLDEWEAVAYESQKKLVEDART